MAAPAKLPEMFEERLQECRQTYKLNVGYAGFPQLPSGFVNMVKQHNPHITELELSSNNLTNLPDDLSDLRLIRVLRLKYNQLKRLPAAVAKLQQLIVLELSGNLINKLDSSIAQLASLKELDLSGNVLTELPTALATLPKLEVLRLENNRLESLPENIGDLPSLTKLDISTNCLRQLPSSMGRLKRIQRIDAANNMLVRVPPAMGHLKTIKELNLRYNNLDDKYKAKADEGLSRLLAFLREEDERERQEEIERLRPIGTAAGPYMEYRCKAEPSQLLKTDFGEFTVDNRCWIRTGYTLTQVNNMVYVFGGQLVKDGTVSNELFWMTSERMEWHAQPTRGDRPSGRYGHVAVYDPDHHALVVFGGRNADKRRLADIAVLDLDTFTWQRPPISGTAPSPREGAAAAYHAGHMVLFGGHGTGGRTNDLMLLELSGWTWQQPNTTGTPPSPRSHAAITVGNGHYVIIHGGRNNFVLEDMHVLDLLTRAWVDASPKGTCPPPRHSHSLHMHNEWLYLFNGINELGASTVTLFKAHLPRNALDRPGSPHTPNAASGADGGETGGGVVLQLDWQELDPELPYNKNRAGVMQQGQLKCYQLGSNMLGRTMNEDDAEKGLAYWDVHKVARLDAFKSKASAVSDREAGSKASRSQSGSTKSSRVQHTIHSAGKMPLSYTTNNAKEQKMLAYIGDFQRVFRELYPYRRPMPLAPLNECGVPKFVCTTLRPSLPPFHELYTLEGCAKFVSEFLTVEPLEDPLHPPEHMPSPMSILTWQAADPFDAATVLCSLLLGAGYNAYMVMGYAALAVTLNDQSETECPWLQEPDSTAAATANNNAADVRPGSPMNSATQHRKSMAGGPASSTTITRGSKAGSDSTAADEPGKRKKYQVRPPPKLASSYLQEHGAGQDVNDVDQSAAASTSQTPEPGAQRQSPTQQAGASGDAAKLQGSGEKSQEDVATNGQQQPRQPPGQQEQQQQKDKDNRVHAWVLVLPGTREVAEPLFVEPLTGRRVSPTSPACPYTGLEIIWNDTNAWICMQAPAPHSDARAAPATINWDLSQTALWEAVLDEHQTRPQRFGIPVEVGGKGGQSSASIAARPGLASNLNASTIMGSMLAGRPRTPSTMNLPRTPTLASPMSITGVAAGLARAGSRQAALGMTAASAAGFSTAGMASGPDTRGAGDRAAGDGASVVDMPVGGPRSRGPPSEYAKSEYARSEYGEGSTTSKDQADDSRADGDLLPDMPPSWVPKLTIPRDMLDMRCPRGARTTLYKRCAHDIFAGFGECARWDGLVERLTLYADDARHVVVEVREIFARRRDKLKERRYYPQQDAVKEIFAPGSLFGVKDLHTVRGERRVINFYSSARLDGLVRRDELLGVKLTEHYTGRDDHLEYRSTTFGSAPATATSDGAGFSIAGSTATSTAGGGFAAPSLPQHFSTRDGAGSISMSGSGGNDRALPVIKMTEKFGRDGTKPADADVAKRVFHLAVGKILVYYHHGEGKLTAGYVVFDKNGTTQAVQVDPLSPKPNVRELLETYRTLQAAEKDVLQAVRDSEWEGREIGRTRNTQEQTITLEAPYYDICRIQADDTDDEPSDAEAAVYDYLLPFLPPGTAAAAASPAGSSNALTHEQALAVRERCLRALKDRLIERANIIQARLDEEQSAFKRRQASFVRDKDALTPAEEAEYERAADEAAFRFGILQRRLARHEEAALQKYYELDKQLRNDARLAVLLAPV